MTAPQNFVQQQGVGVVNADQINTFTQWTTDVATLRTFIGTSTMAVQLLGVSAPNDGGQGVFYWDATSTAADNGYSVIVPNGVTQGAWIRNNFSPVVFPSGGTVSAACGSNYVAISAFTLQLATSTTLSRNCIVTAFAYAGDITVTLTSLTDKINGGTAGASITIPRGYSSTISTDANGNFYATLVLSVLPGTGGSTSTMMSGASVLQINNNVGTPNTKIDVSASVVVLADATHQVRFTAFSKTIDGATTGANGLDTGVLASSTWYFVFIIAGIQTDGTVIKAGLISLSATAPTMPTGYTIAYRVGAMLTDGSTHFYQVKQLGDRAAYIIGTNPAAAIIMISGAQGDPDVPTWHAVPLAAFVPTTAREIEVRVRADAGTGKVAAAPNNNYPSGSSAPIYMDTANVRVGLMMLIEGPNIYYASDDAGGSMKVYGWTDNL